MVAKNRNSITTFSHVLRSHKLEVTLAALALVFTLPSNGFAQAEECTYDICALRMSGGEVRRGTADERVAGFSFFGGAPELPMLSSRTDSAGINYELLRKWNRRGGRIQSVAAAMTLAGLIVTVVDQDYVGWGLGLSFAAYVPMIWGGSYRRRARDHLNRAIWWYNREL